MSDWSTLPEGVVTLVAAKYDGKRSEVIRALREVCKPWRADIVVTKATMPKGAEAPIWQVLQKTPKLRFLYVIEWEFLMNVSLGFRFLDEIRSVKHLVPELKTFVFYLCDLSDCQMPIREYLVDQTTELKILYCLIDESTIENLHDLQHLTSFTLCMPMFDTDKINKSLCLEVFSLMPWLKSISLDHCFMDLENVRARDLPNLTCLSISHSAIWNPGFLSGLTRLDTLDLRSTDIVEYIDGDLVADLPISITTLDVCNAQYDKKKILTEGLFRLASRLTLLSSLSLGTDDEVTNGVLAAVGSMPSLTRLSLFNCDGITDTGLMSLVRSKLERLEILQCDRVTQEGVDALRAAAPSIDIVLEV